jgi:hypothetical protein
MVTLVGLRARRFDCEVPLPRLRDRDDTFERLLHAAAVSFGNSIVPLNFGGSSSMPKLSE